MSIRITNHRKISKIHKHLKITEEQFNRFLALVEQICEHMDIPK
jgi:truncated hemoglobin YjbI